MTGSTHHHARAARSLIALGLLAVLLAIAAPRARADEPVAPLSEATKDLIFKLLDAKVNDRDAIFKQLAVDGDSRLIPALDAYRLGLIDKRAAVAPATQPSLVIYQPSETHEGKKVFPVVDAFTLEPVLSAEGKPEYEAELSKTLLKLPRGDRAAMAELIASLSLLDPDLKKRKAAIIEAGDRANDTLLPALQAQLDHDPKGRLADTLAETIQRIKVIHGERAERLAAVAAIAKKQSMAGGSTLQKALDVLRRPELELLGAIDAADRLEHDIKAQWLLAGTTEIDEAMRRATEAAAAINNKPLVASIKRTSDALPLLSEHTDSYLHAITDLQANRQPSTRPSDLLPVVMSDCERLKLDLQALVSAARDSRDKEFEQALRDGIASVERYQSKIRLVHHTFAGLSLASILILLALGLAIIFGLMGVINMAHGEFMMVGAFATFVVAEGFKRFAPGSYDWYLVLAIPAAFLAAAAVGLACEKLVVKHLYGRPLETLLATWGISLILIQLARRMFGDTVSVSPPSWLSGGWEVAQDLVLPLNRLFIIGYSAACVALVFFVVKKTKVGLILRATTQDREMASALGVSTRRIDGFTFAFGAGLAGLAGCAVVLYDKLNPGMGKGYIVDSFMVVVTGGVGNLLGVIVSGLGLGFLSKYIEPFLGAIFGKVAVLGLIILLLQWRPQGLFPARGRLADA